ncbi:hypothetical protein ACLBWS_05275 [Brucellaceae bacterium D45D]
MHQIDHDPEEPKIDRSPFPWWLLWSIIAVLWFGQWYFSGFDMVQICLGLGTGASLAGWAIEKTGNRIPDSWRGKN